MQQGAHSETNVSRPHEQASSFAAKRQLCVQLQHCIAATQDGTSCRIEKHQILTGSSQTWTGHVGSSANRLQAQSFLMLPCLGKSRAQRARLELALLLPMMPTTAVPSYVGTMP